MNSQFQPFQVPIQQQPNLNERQAPVQDDFYLLDVIGGANKAVLHPSKPIVAYTSGCMIIVYDLLSDSKINLCSHQHEVQSLAFSPPGAGNSPSGGDYLISVDLNKEDLSDMSSASSSTLCLWNWQRGICIQDVQIPKSQNSSYAIQPSQQASSTPKSIQICFDKVGGIFFILESASQEMGGGGYRASLWNLNRHQRVEMISVFELEYQAPAIAINILQRSNQSVQTHLSSMRSIQQQREEANLGFNTNKIRFLTLEKTCIKIWEVNSNNADLLKRIHIKQSMKTILTAEITGFLFILGDNGKILILDQEVLNDLCDLNFIQGEFVSTVSKETAFFTSMAIAHDKLLLGTERGTVCVYHMASLQFINEIPYQLSMLNNFNLNSVTNRSNQRYNNLNEFSSTKKINPLLSDRDSDIRGDDGLSIFKIGPPVNQIYTTTNMRFLMIKYNDSSFTVIDRTAQNPLQAIMGYSYGHFEEITGLQWMNNSGKRRLIDNWQVSQHDNECFVTCSNDMGIFIWKHFGDRWQFSYIDVVKCFDQSLSFQRKQSEKSTQDLRLRSLCLYPKSPLIAVGDNKGILRIFQTDQDKANLISQFKLLKLQDAQIDDGIREIHITQDEQYCIVAFETGLICCYDSKNSFNFIGIIEKDSQRFAYSNMLQIQIKVLENQRHSELSFTNDFRKQDIKPYLNQSFDSDNFSVTGASRPFSHSYRILYTSSPNSVRLQQIEIKGNKLTKTPLVQFVIDEGKVSGFDVHPSNDYLLITSSKGRIYVYRVDTGELRGTMKIPLHAKGCVLDPSGLYVLISVPPFNQKNAQNLISDEDNNYIGQIGGTVSESDVERTTILMFEVGTGLAAAEVKSIFEISQMKFSPDAKYLSLTSKQGAVCVWALGEHLYQNIKQVLDSVQVQPDFWSNYPIFLPDYGVYGMEMTPIREQIYQQQQNVAVVGGQGYLQQDYYRPESGLSQNLDIQNQLQTQQNQGIDSQRSRLSNPSIQRISNRQNKNPQNTLSTNDQRPQQQNMNQLYQSPQKGVQTSERKFDQRLAEQNQQQKFVRKTFVEDQQTQITPHHSQVQQSRQVSQQNINKTIRPTQVQASNNLQNNRSSPYDQKTQQAPPKVPNYQVQSVYSQNLQAQPSASSLVSQPSPNKAEILYRGAYQINQAERNFASNQKSDQQFSPLRQNLSSPLQQQRPYIEETEPLYQPIKRDPRQDFIDRTSNNQQPKENNGISPYQQQEQNLIQDDDPNIDPYEEDHNAAQLYNPFRGSIDTQKQGIGSSLQGFQSNITKPTTFNKPQGRIVQDENKKLNPDPVDIDDDISDQGLDSADQQLKELDGMNKYLQNIRVPTKFVGDDYMERNGKDPEKAYTLERLRQEERLLGSDAEGNFDANLSKSSSTYDLVEDMYDQMAVFDNRIKTNAYNSTGYR